MRQGGGGASDINLLQSDAFTFRNEDYVVNEGLSYSFGTNVAAVAAEFSVIQLWNPDASGVDIMIDRITVTSIVSTFITMRRQTAAEASKVGDWKSTKLDAADGNGELRYDSVAAVAGTTIDSIFVLANSPYDFELEYPVLIPENYGLGIVCQTVNQPLYVSFRGREL
jgi:hypothetical protein